MTAFIDCGDVLFRATFCLLATAGMLGVVCFAVGTSYKLKRRHVLPGFAAGVGALLFFSFLSDALLVRDLGRDRGEFAHIACMMPTWIAALVTAVLLAAVCVCLVLLIRERMLTLTAMSVKEAIAVLPTGLCFYDATGRLLLMNRQIDLECRMLTGRPLLDGTAFWADMCEGRTLPGIVCAREGSSVIAESEDGRVNCYKRITHDFDGRTIFELTETDISREYILKKTLEEKNKQLRRMNDGLRAYGEKVTQLTKERETLAARVKVHDSMGSLILTTKKALSQGDCDKETLIAMWEDILSLISAPEGEEDKFAEAEKTAANVGVKICYRGSRPQKGSNAEKILFAAMTECMTNTARHADGDELTVTVTDDGPCFSAVFENNGQPPKGRVKEGGGLSSLRTMIETAGGHMTTESAPRFRLTVSIPKEAKTNE